MIATLLFLAAQVYTQGGDPLADEQYVLEIINRARANPDAEGLRLATFVDPLPGGNIREGLSAAEAANVGVRPPLAMNVNLLTAARAHSQDMWTRNYFAHDTLSPPTQTWYQRIAFFGYTGGQVGENIAASSSDTAAFLEDYLMVDSLTPGRGHRTNLLDIASAPQPVFREIGVGYYHNNSPNPSGYRDFLTQDFGRSATGPFLVGVVYNDTNANGFYDIGEGLSGVTISHTASSSTGLTATAGGYVCLLSPASSGTVTVTPSGGVAWAPSIRKLRTLTGENLKVDFKTSEAVDTDADGMPDAWETAHGLNPNDATDATGDADLDTFSNLMEYQYGSNPQDPTSTPSNPGSGPPPPAPSGGGGGGGGGCGATGLELLLPWALLRLRRPGRR